MINKKESDIMRNWISSEEVMVSIRCLAYNHEKYIAKCLDGFLMQETSFPFEIIVHDDASTDNSADIIRKYEERFPNIVKPIYEKENLMSKKDGSLSKTIDSAMKGKYIAFCEGDDFWTDSQKLQLQYEALESNSNCSLCVCVVKSCEEDGNPKDIQFPDEMLGLDDQTVIDTQTMVSLLCSGYPFHTSSYFMTRTAYFYCIPNITRFFKRDVGIMLRALLCGNVFFIKKEMSVRRYGAKDGWNTRLKRKGKEGVYKIYIDDFLMFLAFDCVSDGKYREAVFPYLCRRLSGISGYNRKKAVELESKCKDLLGKKGYKVQLRKALKSLSVPDQFMILTFNSNPPLFYLGQYVWHFLCWLKEKSKM